MVSFYSERTVKWENGGAVLIDQSRLPHLLTHILCTDYLQVAGAIKRMRVRGAPAIGVAAAMGLALAAVRSRSRTKGRLMEDLEEAGRVLASTRPTAVNLTWSIERVLSKARGVRGDRGDLVKAVVEEARRMGDEDVEANRRIGAFGSRLIQDGDVVLTHCKWHN